MTIINSNNNDSKNYSNDKIKKKKKKSKTDHFSLISNGNPPKLQRRRGDFAG